MGMTIGAAGGAVAAQQPATDQAGTNSPNQAAFNALTVKMEGQLMTMAEMPMINQMLQGNQDDGSS